jgi:hypothetical protein
MSCQKQIGRRWIGAPSFAMMLMVAGVALASDDKIVHGTACRTLGGSWDPGLDGFYANATQQVVCPLVKDNSTAVPDVVGVRVHESSWSSSNKISCTLYAHSGTAVASTDTVSTTGNGLDSLQLDGSTMSSGNVSQGHVVLCNLSAGDRLRSLRMIEPD